jgi:hypothetical protein
MTVGGEEGTTGGGARVVEVVVPDVARVSVRDRASLERGVPSRMSKMLLESVVGTTRAGPVSAEA